MNQIFSILPFYFKIEVKLEWLKQNNSICDIENYSLMQEVRLFLRFTSITIH